MKIGFYFEFNGNEKIDMLSPQYGNPGIGGTTYMFIILSHYLLKLYDDVEITFFRQGSNNKLNPRINNIYVKDIYNMCLCDKISEMDIVIANAKSLNKRLIDFINKANTNFIMWGHNYLSAEQANLIADCENIKAMVFVGHQEYDKYIDHRIIKKSTYIYNMFNSDLPEFYRNEDYKPYVTYVGSLTKPKGFHILARYWRFVTEKVPDAQLHIIGGGNLYSSNSRLGKFGIADEEYENEFMPYITDEKGKILDSVVFHGVMGQEKVEIYHDTAVGIINPSAETETFGISAVEFSACKIPVVTRRMYGLIDTVKDKKTGLLFDKYDDFPNLIVRLLKDRNLNIEYGKNGAEFIKKFSPEVITKKWYELFNDIMENKKMRVVFPKDSFGVDNKWLRTANYCVKKVLPFLPSVIEATDGAKRLITKCKRR